MFEMFCNEDLEDFDHLSKSDVLSCNTFQKTMFKNTTRASKTFHFIAVQVFDCDALQLSFLTTMNNPCLRFTVGNIK